MNAKFVKTRKFVNDNAVPLAYVAGCVVTGSIFFAMNMDKTILLVTKPQLELVKQGGAVVYELKDQTLHLIDIAAVEARQAAL